MKMNNFKTTTKNTIQTLNRTFMPRARKLAGTIGFFVTILVTLYLIIGSTIPALTRARILRERVTAEFHKTLQGKKRKKRNQLLVENMSDNEDDDEETEICDVLVYDTEDLKTKSDKKEPQPGPSRENLFTKEDHDELLFKLTQEPIPPHVSNWDYDFDEPGFIRRKWNDLKYWTFEVRQTLSGKWKKFYIRIMNRKEEKPELESDDQRDWNETPFNLENRDLFATSRSAYNHFSTLWQDQKPTMYEMEPYWFLNPIWYAHQDSVPIPARLTLKACVANPQLLESNPKCQAEFKKYLDGMESEFQSYTEFFKKIKAAIPTEAVDKAYEYFPLLCILFQSFREDMPLSFSMAIVELLKKWVPAERRNVAVTIGGVITYLIFKTVGCAKRDKQLRAKVNLGSLENISSDTMKTILSVIIVLFMGLLLWKLPQKKDFDSIFNRFGRAGPNIRGLTELTQWVSQNSGAFVNWFEVRYLARTPKDAHNRLRMKLKEYDQPDFIKKMNVDTNLTTDVFLTYLEWIDHIDGLTPRERRDLEPYTRRIVEFKKKAQASPAAGVHFKAEPPVVLLSGNAGVGKTTCIPFLCASHLVHTKVLHKDNIPTDGSDFLGPWVYYAKTSDKHWTGYNSLKTKITIFDDANQAVPDVVEGIPLPILLIHYANSAPTHIPQASLEDKENNSFFNGGLIILSDNIEKPDLKKVILCEEAYTRRLDIVAEVIANEAHETEERTNGTKTWRVPKFKHPPGQFTDAWLFQIKDPVSGRVLDTVDFATFAAMVNAVYDKKRSNFQANNENLSQFTLNLIPKSSSTFVRVLCSIFLERVRGWIVSTPYTVVMTLVGIVYWPLAISMVALRTMAMLTVQTPYVVGENQARDLKRLVVFLVSIPTIYFLWKTFWHPTFVDREDKLARGAASQREERSRDFVAKTNDGIYGHNARRELKISDYFEECAREGGYTAKRKLDLTPQEWETLNRELEYRALELQFLRGEVRDLPLFPDYLEEIEQQMVLLNGPVERVREDLVFSITRNIPVELEADQKKELEAVVEKILLKHGTNKTKSYQAKNPHSAARDSRQKLTNTLKSKVYAGTETRMFIEKKIDLNPDENFVSPSLRTSRDDPDLERYLMTYDKFALDQNLRCFVTNKVAKATYVIRLLGSNVRPSMNCLFVKGNLAVAPRHFFYNIQNYTKIEFIQANGSSKLKFQVPLSDIRLFPIGEGDRSKDVCYLYVPPRYVRRHADLTKCFHMRSEIYEQYRNRFFIYGYKMFDEDLSIHMACTTGAYHNPVVGLGDAVVVNSLVLNLYVSDGICGSVLGTMANNKTHQLFGIVNGGDIHTTVCSIITQEEINMVSRHLAEIGIENGVAEDIEESSISPFCRPYIDRELFNFPNMRNTATLMSKAFISPDTKFVQSPLFEVFGKSTTRPVNIGGRTPEMEKKCFSKYNCDQVLVAMKDLSIFRMGVIERLRGAVPYISTLDKAIRGDSETGIQPMNRKTSPGFPWLEFGRNAGKKEWLGENEEWMIHEDLASAVGFSEEKARQGITEFVVWMDQYKDERLPISKVESGKIRLFAIGPLHFNVLCRKYLIWAMEHLVLHKIENGSLVGIDPEAHFKSLYTKISEINDPHSACMIAGDYSNFDGSLARPFLYEIGDVLASMMVDEDAVALRAIWEALISSNHVFQGHVYSLSQSQPSGNIFTTHLNTLYNLAIIEMVIKKVAWKSGFEPGERDFRVFAYGDDNIVVFSKAFIENVPQTALHAIPDMMRDYGHTYTTDAKDSQNFEYRPITDITILKRHFLVEERHVFAPLCLTTVLERNYWMSKTRDEDVISEQMEMNLYTTYMDLAQHALPTFKKYARIIRECYSKFGGDKTEIGLTHDQLRDICIDNARKAEMERQYKLKAFSTLRTKMDIKEADRHIDKFDFLHFLTGATLWLGTDDHIYVRPRKNGWQNVVMGFQTEKASFRINVRHTGYDCPCSKELLIMFFIDAVLCHKTTGDLIPFEIGKDAEGREWIGYENYLETPNTCTCKDGEVKEKLAIVWGFLCVGPSVSAETTIKKVECKEMNNRNHQEIFQHISTAPEDPMSKKTCYGVTPDGVEYVVHPAEELKTKSDNTIPEVQKILEVQDVESPDMQTLEGATATPILDKVIGEEKKENYSVRDITERKWQLATVLINSGNLPGSIVYTANLPNDLFVIPQVARMVSNFIHFRADFEIEIIATVNPQVAWAVRCFIAPDLDPNFLLNRTGTLLQQSQFVNSIMKGPSQPRMQITLPWVSQFSHRNISTVAGNAGSFYIAPITQADGPVNLAVYVTMKNVELQYPVEYPIVYLKDGGKKHAYRTLGYKVVSGEHLKPKGLLTLLAGEAKNILASGLAAGIQTGINSIGKIPVVGPLASTALTRYSGAQCKPLSDEPSHRVAVRPIPDNVNVQGLEIGTNFGLDTLNSVSHEAGVAGTASDDMSFQRFYTHPNYVASFSVSGADIVGKRLLRLPIWPFNGRSLSTVTYAPQIPLSINMQKSGAVWFQFVGATDVLSIMPGESGSFVALVAIFDSTGALFAPAGNGMNVTTTGTTWSIVSSIGTTTGSLPAAGESSVRFFLASAITQLQERITFQEYVVAPFKYWNGRAKFDIYLALTAFHSVKLRVVEVYGLSSATLDSTNVGAYPSTIHEFGVSDFVQITTAAPSTFNYKLNPRADSKAYTADWENSIGFIDILVEVPLEHPASVSSTVSGWVEQSFVEMVVGTPISPELVPILGNITLEAQSVKYKTLGEMDKDKDPFIQEMVRVFRLNHRSANSSTEFIFKEALFEDFEPEIKSTQGLRTKSDVKSLRPEGARLKEDRFGGGTEDEPLQVAIPREINFGTFGESITSFSELAKVFSGSIGIRSSAPIRDVIVNTLSYAQHNIAHAPFMTQLDYIQCAYGFFKGSMALRIIPTQGNLRLKWHPRFPISAGARIVTRPTQHLSINENMGVPDRNIIFIRGLEGGCQIRVPSYNPYSILRNSPNAVPSGSTQPVAGCVSFTLETNTSVAIYLAFGDDRRCYQPVGLPPFERIRQRDFGILPL